MGSEPVTPHTYVFLVKNKWRWVRCLLQCVLGVDYTSKRSASLFWLFMRKTAGRENKFDRLTFQSDACGGPLVLMGHHTGTYFSLICSRFQTFVSVLHESNCAVVGYTGNHQNYEAGNNKCAKTASRKESQVILTEPVPEFWPTCCLKKI